MTRTAKRKSYLNLTLVLITALMLFCFGSYKLLAEQLYYHITVEQYVQDNETVTEAFKKESALRRHLERSLATEQIDAEKKEKLLQIKQQELASKEKTIEDLQQQYKHLQTQFRQTKHEKDSLTAVISSLRRVH